ncbi:fumarate hydratase [Candidatus Soleaferrea massiliensis]|uniref:fumarate hydratase n=1 Tax=Candidatus Soleaferrea massiliensis TaxID=1470354 RepID=UPI00058B5468|nr:fumarate hydratase [Candidatus Soleaferrea massiliensis]
MRELDVRRIAETIRELCIKANKQLPDDIEEKMCACCELEQNALGKSVMEDLVENFRVAKELDIPVCQDTGMAVVFIELGQDVHLTGGLLEDAVNEGVRRGYLDGLLRCSIVSDPLERVNTGDNTPAVLHLRMVEGDQVRIMVAPKGFGSENMSRLKMFTPAAGREDVIDFVLETVKLASSNPCPPMVVGVGIGGDFEWCAYLAKKALCRSCDTKNDNAFYARMEDELLERVNQLGIGPQGFGGDITALKVNIETYATHIAGLPVSVNIGCHVTRHCSAVL